LVREESMSWPPQISIFDPVQTAEWRIRALGAVPPDTGVQVSDPGSYRAPAVRTDVTPDWRVSPPHTIMRVPAQTAPCESRARGAFVRLTGSQVLDPGSNRPPVLKALLLA
jgi:hypothetical protein